MKFSIIIPMFNLENYIAICLNSLLNQTYKNFEIIIVDDGSKDNSVIVAESLLQKSNFYDWRIIKQTNGGVGAARNKGIDYVSGQFVIFLDGDDFVSPRLIEILTKYYNMELNFDILFYQFERVFDINESPIDLETGNNDCFEIVTNSSSILKILNDEIKISMPSIAFDINKINEFNIRFKEDCINGEDREFIFNYLFVTEKSMIIPETLFFYVQRPTSISNSFSIRRIDSVYAYIRILNNFKKNKNKIFTKDFDLIKNSLGTQIFAEYIGNFNNFLRFKGSTVFLNSNTINTIVKKIEEEYPFLNNDLDNLYKSISMTNSKTKFMTKIYKVNLLLYSNIINIFNNFQKLKKSL